MRAAGLDGLEVTEAGLREGVFFERVLADREAPLLSDVRRASVLNLAAQYDSEPRHTMHVAALALGLFDELAAAGLHDGDPAERELLWAASLVHDIGVAVDYDDHHKHSRYLVLNAGLPGFSPREVALIGQAVRYHRKGMPDLGPFAPLMRKGDAALLDRCAVLLRLAEDLERSRDQLVREAHVGAGSDGALELRLIADGDDRVPRWAASRETELFARAFGRELVVA
jgi:exopolyphosphatase/guanosine-5'-triphosphate,3'-diphosphate pyrophosphatase